MSGSLRLQLPEAWVHKINASLLKGRDAVSIDEDDASDLTGELCNMIAGRIAASLAGARATMRYASDPYARRQAQLIFGGAARNNPAAFDELAAQFQSTRWDEGRADFALPLALTDDLRCPALLVESLRQAPPSAADVSGILEALDQLDIAWQWIAEIQGIELPDFSRISNLPGLSFPPLERTLRA